MESKNTLLSYTDYCIGKGIFLLIISRNNISDNIQISNLFNETLFDVVEIYETIDGLREKLQEDRETVQRKAVVIKGTIDKTEDMNYICTRYISLHIKLLALSTKKFKNVSHLIRKQITDIIIWNPKKKALLAVALKYGEHFNGPKNWLKLYKQCIINDSDFCYMNFQNINPIMYRNFDTIISIGV